MSDDTPTKTLILCHDARVPAVAVAGDLVDFGLAIHQRIRALQAEIDGLYEKLDALWTKDYETEQAARR